MIPFMEPRVIFHVDMDAFFASIEQLDRPELRGRPVLVGHDGPRGVVAAASYEAREFGCRSAQPMAVARRLCPHAAIVPGRGRRYQEISRRVFSIFHEYSPLVEPISLDEAFLDLTGTRELFGDPVEVAEEIRRRIRERTELTASVGVAPNKFLAKLASDENKPDGLTVIGKREIEEWLPALPIRKMWGIGKATEARLSTAGIRLIGDLRRLGPKSLASVLGSEAERFHRLSLGLDDRPVVPSRPPKSIGHEQTFERDLPRPEDVHRVLLRLVEKTARRLRKAGLRTRGLTLKIRFGNYETITRSSTWNDAIDTTEELWKNAKGVFDTWATPSFRPVRLIGISANHLQGASAQLGLFQDRERRRQSAVDRATDEIQEKFGSAAIRRGMP